MARELTKTAERPSTGRTPQNDPFREMIGFRDTINGMFEDFFSGRPLLASFSPGQYRTEQGWAPPVDIYDAGEELLVYACLPGVKKEDCRIDVQDGTLVLSGENHHPQGAVDKEQLRHEAPCGKFYRAFSLPADVNADQAKASYRDGILEIRLPKSESAKARRVEIQ